MTAPTVTMYKDAIWYPAGATTRDLAQITVATGDVVAVVTETDAYVNGYASALAKQSGTAVITAPAAVQEAGSSGECGCGLFTFTVTTGGTLVLRVTLSATGVLRSTSWTYVATGSAGIGVTGKTTTSTTTITTSLTVSQDSYVIAHAADWNATAGATTTLTPGSSPSPVLDAHEVDGVNDATTTGAYFSSRGGHWSPVNAGTASYGTSVPTSAKYVQVACELLGAGGNVDFTATPGSADGAGAAYDAAAQIGAATSALFAGSATGISGSWSNTGNATGSTQGTYATWTDSAAGSSAALELAAFGADAAVPAGSTVQSVTCTVRHGEAPSSAVASVTAQAYSGTTPVGSAQPLSPADAVHDDTVTFTGLAYADLADLRVRVTVTRT